MQTKKKTVTVEVHKSPVANIEQRKTEQNIPAISTSTAENTPALNQL